MSEEFQQVAAKCKFCGVSLTLSISPDFIFLEPGALKLPKDFAAIGSYNLLVKLAACNRCADARMAWFKVADKLRKLVTIVRLGGNKEFFERCEKRFGVLAVEYGAAVALLKRREPVPEDYAHGPALLHLAQTGKPLWEVLKKLWPTLPKEHQDEIAI